MPVTTSKATRASKCMRLIPLRGEAECVRYLSGSMTNAPIDHETSLTAPSG